VKYNKDRGGIMVKEFNPPPKPTTPERAPWEEVRLLTQKLNELISLMKQGMVAPGVPGAPGFPGAPGAPGTIGDLILIMQELVPETIGKSAVVTFQKTVATSYQDEQERMVPFDGIIRDVLIAFPSGCQQLVEVRLMYLPRGGGRKYIVPTIEDSFIALDDFTALFQPRFPIKAPGNLRVEWWNYDSLNTHSVPVIVTVVPTRMKVPE